MTEHISRKQFIAKIIRVITVPPFPESCGSMEADMGLAYRV